MKSLVLKNILSMVFLSCFTGCAHLQNDPWRGIQRFELRGVQTVDERDGKRNSACIIKDRIRDVQNKGWILVCK